MNFYAASSLFVFLCCVLFGFLVLVQDPTNRKNLTFFALCMSLGMWTGFYTLWQMATNELQALLYTRLLMVGCAFGVVTQYHHSMTLFDAFTPRRRRLLYSLYALDVFFTLNSLGPYFVKGVEPRLGFPFWPIPGPLMDLLFLTVPIPVVGTIILIWEERAKSPLQNNRLKWLLFLTLIGYSSGITNIPLWYHIPIHPYPHALVAALPATAAFSFFKLGLVDIGLFIRRSIVFLLTSFLLGFGGAGATYLVFRNIWFSLVIMALAFLFHPVFSILRRWVESALAKTFFWKGTLKLKMLDKSVDKIKETTYTYDDLARNIVLSLMETFPVNVAAVYFFDLTRKELDLRAQKGMKNPLVGNLRYNRSSLSIPDADPLTRILSERRIIVNYESLVEESRKTPDLYKPVLATMDRIEAEVCSPFLIQGSVRGMVVLGKKNDNSLYNAEDIEALDAFTRMGEEIMRYIMGMETELRNTSLYSHDMAHDVRSIIQTLEFVLSPMAAGQPKEKVNNLISKAKEVAFRLNDIFQMNRDRSSLILRAVRGEYEKAPVEMTAIVNSTVQKYSLEAEQKKVNLSIRVQPKPYTFQGNDGDLRRVVDNLVSNALRYVPSGGSIEVDAHEDPKGFTIIVKDTGEGIDPGDLEKIWGMGWQGKDNKKGSAGLGLSIVKQIVEMHAGTIQAFSEGSGTGTMFTIHLPSTANATN